jgi:hypothetical protein
VVVEGAVPKIGGTVVVALPVAGVVVLCAVPKSPPEVPVAGPVELELPNMPPVVPVAGVVVVAEPNSPPPLAGLGGCPKSDVPVPVPVTAPVAPVDVVIPNRDGAAGAGVPGLFTNNPPVLVELAFVPNSPAPEVVAGAVPNRAAGLSAVEDEALSAGFGG